MGSTVRVAVLVATGFEQEGLRLPCARLRAAGHEVVLIGAAGGQGGGDRTRRTGPGELGIEHAWAEEFDALLVPGGEGVGRLVGDPRVIRFARAFRDAAVFAIDEGIDLVEAAGLVQGRRIAHEEPGRVVVDRELVTCRHGADLDRFAAAALEQLDQGVASLL